MRIVLVENHSDVARIIRAMLNALGHSVQTFSSGLAALEILTTNTARYDLLITDFHLGDMTGQDLLRALGGQIDAGVIVYTASDELATVLRRFGPRVVGLAKPFRLAELSEAVERAWKLSERCASSDDTR
jgi:CheY-like chemotaxis protein